MVLLGSIKKIIFGRLKLSGKLTLALGLGLMILITAMIYQAISLQRTSLGKMRGTSEQISGIITKLQIAQNRIATRNNAEALGKLLASIAPDAIVSYDLTALSNYALMSVKNPDISYVSFTNKTNKTLGEAGDKSQVNKNLYIHTQIKYDGSILGKAVIGYNHDRLNASIGKSKEILSKSNRTIQRAMEDSLTLSTNRLLYIGVIFLVVTLLLTYITSSSMGNKLRRMIRVMQLFSNDEQNREARCEVESNDEIGEVSAEFNKMADSLEKAAERDKENLDELRRASDISEKVNSLLEVVTHASQGDLTGEVIVSGHDSIDRLGEGINTMMQSLNMLVQQVQKSGIMVTSSATEIAATSKEQEATVTEQAASTSEIMATVTEISATTKELVNTMAEVSNVSDNAAVSASEGHEALTMMESTMKQMDDATASISSKLAILNDKASNINNVVTTINKVADQTNLLSLNAAIEAEKAGEYGRGFAVVATEIRRLADQTAVATWDIEQMVKEMQSAVSAGVMGMDKFSEEVNRGVEEVREVGGRLAHIIEQVQTLTPRFEAVSLGMKTQSSAASQITDSMSQLNDTAHQTADSLRQSNQSIQQLKGAAKQLQDGVSRFKIKQG